MDSLHEVFAIGFSTGCIVGSIVFLVNFGITSVYGIIRNDKNQPEHLHWTHIIISNAKAYIGGTLHGLDKIHLQRYLDEFCYRFNRRLAPGVFPKLVNACVGCGRAVAHELIG